MNELYCIYLYVNTYHVNTFSFVYTSVDIPIILTLYFIINEQAI